MTKQNIVYAINKFVQFNVNSTPIYMQTMKQIIQYLIETNDLKIQYKSSNEIDENLINYIDLTYNDNVITKRSHLNYVFKF